MTINRTLKTIQLVFATLIVVLAMSVPGHASAAGISASPDPSPAGSTVTVAGSGFDPGEVVEINFAGDIVMTTADGNGNVQTPFTINPTVPAGTHPLDANGANGNSANSNLTVNTVAPVPTVPPAPVAGQGTVAASPDPAPAGSTVTVSGSGFLPGETIEINFAGDTVTTTADGSGSYQTPFTINRGVPIGSHPLDANGMGGSWATSNLTVSASVPQPGPTIQPAPATTPAPNQANTPPPPVKTTPSTPTPSTPTPSAPTPSAPTPAPDSGSSVSESGPTKRQLESNEVGTVEQRNVSSDEASNTEAEADERRDEAGDDDQVVVGPSQNSSSDSGTSSSGLSYVALLLILVAGFAVAGAVFLALRPSRETKSPDEDTTPITFEGWVPPVGPMA